MNANTNIPATRNEAWGFWGTMRGVNQSADTAWRIAMTAIAATTGEPLENIRVFLDSRYGRHFADEVYNHTYAGAGLEQAIGISIQKWGEFNLRVDIARCVTAA